MFFLFIELRKVVEVAHTSVDAGPDEAAGAELLEHVQMLTLPCPDDGSQQHQS